MPRFRLAAILLLALVAGAGAAPTPTPTPAPLKTLELGNGPTIVFVHDLGARGTAWLPVAKKLLGAHKTVLVDLPGHGDSPMMTPFSLPAAAEALDQVLARQEAKRTVVVGHGVGGLVALYEAKAHPERIKGLVLIETGARGLPIPDQQKPRFMEFLDTQYDVFLRAMYANIARDSAQFVAMHAQAALVPPATFKAYLRELLYADPSKAAKDLAVPVLYVGGANHRWSADKDGAAVAKEMGFEGMRRASGRRLTGSGYFVMADQPDSLAARVAWFAAEAIAVN
jgi:pimeloyl-ACP methyl ester carboxylesterase